MAVRLIDGNKLIEWFRPYLHTGEAIPADVVIEDIRSMPTLTSPNESRMINADILAKRIAGHSNYHGDSILAAIYCAAEGKENNTPIRPIENPPNEWVKVDENLPDFDVPVLVYVKDIFDNKSFISITKYTITYDLTNNWLGYENSSFKITHWMPLPKPPTMET